MKKFLTPRNLGVYVALAVTALVAVLAINAKVQVNDLHEGLVKNCQQNGNPMRRIIAASISKQVAQSKAFEESGKYQQFFPNVPADQLHALLVKSRRQQEAEIAKLAPLDCEAVFR